MNNNILLDKGIILSSGEISKDKINLVAGAITQWSYVKKKYKLNMPFLVLSYPAKASALLSNAA